MGRSDPAPADGTAASSPAANLTGLPDQLKAGVEALSGFAMDDVRVHRDSAEPAKLGALAYANGSDIHLGPGGERHLPHEAWHVVQQKQGRVRATVQTKSALAVNEDPILEGEADAMGRVASSMRMAGNAEDRPQSLGVRRLAPNMSGRVIVQCLLSRERADFWQTNKAILPVRETNWVKIAQDLEEQIQLVRDSLDLSTEDEKQKKKNADITADLDDMERTANNEIAIANKLMTEHSLSAQDFILRYEDQLVFRRQALEGITAELQTKYRPGGSGFTAVGRASSIPAQIVEDGGGNSHFFRGIEIGGRSMAHVGALKKVDGMPDQSLTLRIGGKDYDPDDSPPDYKDDLPIPKGITINCQRIVGIPRPSSGQEGEMGISARAYAWVSGTKGWNTRAWDWLHIRGASVGGETTPENLVLGTADANTHMMPFESNLKYLSNILENDESPFTKMRISWSIEATDTEWTHRVSAIGIEWNMIAADEKPATATGMFSGKAKFDPLHPTEVLTKDEVKYLQSALKTHRETITAAKQAGSYSSPTLASAAAAAAASRPAPQQQPQGFPAAHNLSPSAGIGQPTLSASMLYGSSWRYGAGAPAVAPALALGSSSSSSSSNSYSGFAMSSPFVATWPFAPSLHEAAHPMLPQHTGMGAYHSASSQQGQQRPTAAAAYQAPPAQQTWPLHYRQHQYMPTAYQPPSVPQAWPVISQPPPPQQQYIPAAYQPPPVAHAWPMMSPPSPQQQQYTADLLALQRRQQEVAEREQQEALARAYFAQQQQQPPGGTAMDESN